MQGHVGPSETTTGFTELSTDCVNAAVVGLRWDPPRGMRVARYEITRNGTLLDATRETYFTDTTVAESTLYSYTVTAVLATVAAPSATAAAPSSVTAEIDTPPASASGDAPYCQSRYITSINWDWAGAQTEPNGSDLWPVTWGRDGRVYTFFGDGGGFGGDNYRGRASFGIATMTGPPPLTPAQAHNLYGGYNSEHPSRIAGKAGAIIAVGSTFYTLGGLYTEAETAGRPDGKSGSPSRVQLAYSKGNAYSWRRADWAFCEARDGQLRGHFCPSGFINYGRGNSGAPGGQVYLLGFINSAGYWGSEGSEDTPGPATTYLARVPARKLLDSRAYRYFAGLDAHGHPIWTADQTLMRPIFTDRNTSRPGCSGRCNMAGGLEEATYDRSIGRYIAVAQGEHVGQTSLYDAPYPWGPWTTVDYNNIDPATGSGGWANLGTAAGAALGAHVVNAWTSSDGLTLWLTYSSDKKAPTGALFPPAGTIMDSFNLVRARLVPGPELLELRRSRWLRH